MSSVQVKIGLAKYFVYMIQTLPMSNRSIFEVVIFLHINMTTSCNGEIFNPTYRDTMRTSVTAPFANVSQSLFSTITVSINSDDQTVVSSFSLIGFKNTVGYTFGVLKMLLPPKVGQRLMFPKCTMPLHTVTINIVLRTNLLVHRNTK